MSFDVTQLHAASRLLDAGRVAPPAPTQPTTPPKSPDGASFADVLDFQAAQARREVRRAGDIPGEVWAEVEAANRLFDELQAEGQRVSFDNGRLDGRVVISLCDLEGRVLRSVEPGELVGVPPLDIEAARAAADAAKGRPS